MAVTPHQLHQQMRSRPRSPCDISNKCVRTCQDTRYLDYVHACNSDHTKSCSHTREVSLIHLRLSKDSMDVQA